MLKTGVRYIKAVITPKRGVPTPTQACLKQTSAEWEFLFTMKRRPPEERFWDKVEKTDGCWIWKAATNKRGYGSIGLGFPLGTALAHRVSWIIHYGSIPDGMDVLHTCDNPPCTNPSHLFLGTNLDNMRDRKSKGRYDLHGEKNPIAILTDEAIADIRANYVYRKVPLRVFAKRYGVETSAIHMVVKRKGWNHIP